MVTVQSVSVDCVWNKERKHTNLRFSGLTRTEPAGFMECCYSPLGLPMLMWNIWSTLTCNIINSDRFTSWSVYAPSPAGAGENWYQLLTVLSTVDINTGQLLHTGQRLWWLECGSLFPLSLSLKKHLHSSIEREAEGYTLWLSSTQQERLV